MQPTKNCKVVYETSLLHPLEGPIDVGLLGENHHKINLIACGSLLLNEGVVPFLWIISYIASLSR